MVINRRIEPSAYKRKKNEKVCSTINTNSEAETEVQPEGQKSKAPSH